MEKQHSFLRIYVIILHYGYKGHFLKFHFSVAAHTQYHAAVVSGVQHSG